MEFDISILKPGDGLTPDNFFNQATQEWPLAMERFQAWIDQYQKLVRWPRLFINRQKCRGVQCKPDFIKFHELPLEMQVGILFTFFGSEDQVCHSWQDMLKQENQIGAIIDLFGDLEKFLQEEKALVPCRKCGCTEHDPCIHPDHGNCYWVEPDLCSHCKLYPGEAVRYSLRHQQ